MSVECSYRQYWQEIRSIPEWVFEECREYGRDPHEALHEWVDGHSWIIYTFHAEQIMRHTDNADSYFEEVGDLTGQSWAGIVSVLAYYAMRRDIETSQEWADGLEAFEG